MFVRHKFTYFNIQYKEQSFTFDQAKNDNKFVLNKKEISVSERN